MNVWAAAFTRASWSARTWQRRRVCARTWVRTEADDASAGIATQLDADSYCACESLCNYTSLLWFSGAYVCFVSMRELTKSPTTTQQAFEFPLTSESIPCQDLQRLWEPGCTNTLQHRVIKCTTFLQWLLFKVSVVCFQVLLNFS